MDNTIDNNKKLVVDFYTGGTVSENAGYGAFFHPDFTVTAPTYLPWGGTNNLKAYLENILPQVTTLIDFSKLTFDSITAEEGRVIALVNVGVLSTGAMIKISEHWLIKNNKAMSLWVAYFEPEALIALIESKIKL